MKRPIIAIDGPAASGKSTVGHAVADTLGYLYLDTGVLYRAVTWAALERGILIADEERVARLAESLDVDIRRPTVDDGRQYTVLVAGRDVTWHLREQPVNEGVSPVAANPGVRAALVDAQRRIGLQGGVVVVGRDIGTAILPEAQVKIYLDAALEERALRRHRENLAQGRPSDLDAVRANLAERDYIDSHRSTAPLAQAPDAVYLDSTALTIPQVVARVLEIARCREACGALDHGQE